MTSEAVALLASATELSLVAASMRWHPIAEEVFWLALVVVLCTWAWLREALDG